MIKIICDRCGAEIKPGKIGYVALNFRESLGGALAAANMFEDFHFCQNCMEGISDYITNPGKKEKADTLAKEVRGGGKADGEKAQSHRLRQDHGAA